MGKTSKYKTKRPARIVTLSESKDSRNFTLGQGLWNSLPAELYNVRLRTTATTGNGITSLSSPSYSLTTDLTHVVYTRNASGTANLYINGVEMTSRVVSGELSNWNENYHLALANEITGNRAWLGELYLAAIYDRALEMEEVKNNFAARLNL